MRKSKFSISYSHPPPRNPRVCPIKNQLFCCPAAIDYKIHQSICSCNSSFYYIIKLNDKIADHFVNMEMATKWLNSRSCVTLFKHWNTKIQITLAKITENLTMLVLLTNNINLTKVNRIKISDWKSVRESTPTRRVDKLIFLYNNWGFT